MKVQDLSTKRLELRPWTSDEIEAMHRLFNDAEVRRFLWDDRLVARDEVAEVMEASRQCFDVRGFGFWSIRLTGESELIGFCGMRPFGEPPRVELLYALSPAYWHRGFATEAARAVLEYGFSKCGLQEIYAGADLPNSKSFEVMRRLGMVFSEHSRSEIGAPVDYFVIRAATCMDSPPSSR